MQQSPSKTSTSSPSLETVCNNEPGGSLLHSQEPATYPVLSQINPTTPCQPICLRSIYLLASYLRPYLPRGHFSSDLLTKTLFAPLLSPHTCDMPQQSISFRFRHPHTIWRGIQIINFTHDFCSKRSETCVGR